MEIILAAKLIIATISFPVWWVGIVALRVGAKGPHPDDGKINLFYRTLIFIFGIVLVTVAFMMMQPAYEAMKNASTVI